MKKLLIMFFGFIISLSVSAVVYADSIGQLDYVKDVVTSNKENSVITTSIKGTTDSKGGLIIPCYKDAEIANINVKNGKIVEKFKKEKNGSLEYYIAKFEGKNDKVEFVITQTQKKTYKISESKQKDTFPGNVKMVTYKMVNNTPIEIKKYVLEMAIPKEYELFNIVGYDPEKPYSIFSKDGIKYGAFEFGKLSAGKDIKFSINIYKTGRFFNLTLWGTVILISAFFMYKNKEILRQAKEIKETTKQQKIMN